MQRSRRFGWITDPGASAPGKVCDTIIHETSNFAVVPSQGALVPGWLLVIPRRPMINLTHLNAVETEELNTLTIYLRRRLSLFAGDVFEFEHGAHALGSVTGCGVDQAHLHVVPLPFNLLQACRTADPSAWLELDPAFPWQSLGGEYLLARHGENSAIATAVSTPQSQWFRKLIAKQVNKPNCWDYRAFPFYEAVSETLRSLRAA